MDDMKTIVASLQAVRQKSNRNIKMLFHLFTKKRFFQSQDYLGECDRY